MTDHSTVPTIRAGLVDAIQRAWKSAVVLVEASEARMMGVSGKAGLRVRAIPILGWINPSRSRPHDARDRVR